MSTFASLIPSGAVTPSPRALAVILLDRAGADPDAMKTGVTVIGCAGDVVDFVADAIDHIVFGGQADIPNWENPSAESPAHILSGDVHNSKFNSAVALGKPVVVVARHSRLPEGADIQADRRYDVHSTLTDDIISDVVRLVTGDAVDCTDIADKIGSEHLLATSRPGLSGSVVVERLREMIRRVDAANAKRKTEESKSAIAKIADAVPLVDAAERVVVKLSDLSGFGAAKDFGMQLASDLRAYADGSLPWADVDKGLLLVGAPGTGKTFYAQALAAECGVPLIQASYGDMEAAASSWQISKAIKKTFADARKRAPCIVFMDELDSYGVRGGNAHNDSFWGALINSLLAELDGAEPRPGVFVCAATNHPDRIDPALKRPGRLERTVDIPLPDISAIGGIIAHHCPDLPGDVDAAARACRGKSPATIAMLCRQARRAARKAGRHVTAQDVRHAAWDSIPQRDDALDQAFCLHEASHAVVSLAVGLDVKYVDADAGHCCVAMEPILTRAQIEAHIVGMLAARRADAMIGGGVHSGAITDLAQATAMARKAVAQCGLSGSVYHHGDNEAMLTASVREDVQDMLETLDLRAAKLVDSHREAILGVAEALRERRYLDGQEVDQVIVDTLRALTKDA
jgi:SpoVK/Ycf46/Vps4 family AAA+-type ATPase